MDNDFSMTLREWTDQHGLTQTEVARRLGISQGHVNDLMSGRFYPGRTVAARIWKMTDGAVTPNDFLSPEERGETPN